MAFGRVVSETDRTATRDAFREANSDVVDVDGLAPITPLLVAQFEEALDRRPETQQKLEHVRADHGLIEIELRAPVTVRVTLYRLTRLYRTWSTGLSTKSSRPGRGPSSSHARSRAPGKRSPSSVPIRARSESSHSPLRPRRGGCSPHRVSGSQRRSPTLSETATRTTTARPTGRCGECRFEDVPERQHRTPAFHRLRPAHIDASLCCARLFA